MHQVDGRNQPTPSLLPGKRIVIAEDEGIQQMQLRKILLRAGAVIIEIVGDGEQAVQVTLRERPDILLIDIGLPRLNGIEASRRITAQLPNVCVVVVTAYPAAEYALIAKEAGVCGIISKPITSEEFLPRLEQHYREFSTTPAL